MKPIILMWLRHNLRLADNQVLHAALAHGLPVVAVYADMPSENPRRAAFCRQAAEQLHGKLAERGIPLWFAQSADDIPDIAVQQNAVAVLADEAYTPSEILQDNRIWQLLDAQGILFKRFNDRTVFAKREIVNKYHEPFTDFSGYKQAWLAAYPQANEPQAETDYVQTAFDTLPPFPDVSDGIPLWQQGGEEQAWRQWQQFSGNLGFYSVFKDFPARKGTSQLSAYISSGCISVRTLAKLAVQSGDKVWLNELIRRDFYQQLAFNQSDMQGKSQDSTVNPLWLNRWQQGQTGFPLIDATMRCLDKTGWLHPALRTAAAVFWCQTLAQPWQAGAAWFARVQTDYDEALNLGNWQAAAHAKPQNQILLAQQTDPDGTFIRSHVPELAHLPPTLIHAPWLAGEDVDRHGYPLPIINAV